MSFFNTTTADTLQLIAVPLEIIGLSLAVADTFFKGVLQNINSNISLYVFRFKNNKEETSKIEDYSFCLVFFLPCFIRNNPYR